MGLNAIALPLLLLSAAWAGCLTGDVEPDDPSDDRVPSVPKFEGERSLRQPVAPAETGRTGSLAVAPVLQVGEWWRIRLESPLLTDGPITWTRVVAGIEGPDYLIGQPREQWVTEGLLFHVPGLGEVSRSDLSYEAHDVRFHALRFPLVAGASWDTSFEGRPVTAEVALNDDGTVAITYCCGRSITATYDPLIGGFRTFEVDGLLRYEVIAHGTGFEGVVTVPHGHDLVFDHGRSAGILDVRSGEPVPPREEIVLSDDYDRVSFVQLAGDRSLPTPVTGAYVERLTAPDGTQFETVRSPEAGPGLTVNVYEAPAQGGTWVLEHVAPGQGIAFTEGLAYHVFDVSLPDGTLEGDHREHITE